MVIIFWVSFQLGYWQSQVVLDWSLSCSLESGTFQANWDELIILLPVPGWISDRNSKWRQSNDAVARSGGRQSTAVTPRPAVAWVFRWRWNGSKADVECFRDLHIQEQRQERNAGNTKPLVLGAIFVAMSPTVAERLSGLWLATSLPALMLLFWGKPWPLSTLERSPEFPGRLSC